MRQSNYSFLGPDVLAKAMENSNNTLKAFDWDQAAKIIKEEFAKHPDLIAEAGLQADWDYTGGVIFQGGKPISDTHTYLASTWATPTLLLSWDGADQYEVPCFTNYSKRFHSSAKWDDQSLAILGINP